MKTFTHTMFAERVGWALGHAWAAYKRQERRAVELMVGKGLTTSTAKIVLWGLKLLLLGGLLYAALWLTLVLTFVVAAALIANHVDADRLQGQFTEDPDHKKNLFYDPINYNDDPDPRFDDK
jgi:Protein of unknown function (DUF3742)